MLSNTTRHRRVSPFGTRTWHWIAGLASSVLLATQAPAQLAVVEIKPKHPSFVSGEPLMIRLTLENHGAQPIVIGDHEAFKDNRVFFEIRKTPDEFLPLMRQSKIVADIALEHGEAMSVEIDLAEWYPLLAYGRYYVNAVLIHNQRRYASDNQVFEVVPGIELSRVTQVIRGPGVIERNFTLVYWARGDSEDAFLRIVDQPANETWTTLDLGPIVRVKKPELKLEGEAHLTVYHQTSRDVLLTTLVRSDAAGPVILEQRKTIDSVSSPMVNTLGDALDKAVKQSAKHKSR